ncbi:hypothetical protein [Pseudoruegeria sp. HB172150]|uniref:hypothetical protein n=1 Tax=Pseudoruegeria sp. HB172150 TaxID=2721164 RepID=UPI00155780E9|nr:hypothetical protein [Pseudoruegeria sp. HB172150]
MAAHPTKTLLVVSSLLALAACGDRTIFSSWTQEAGAFIDDGTFGNATMRNQLAQKCNSYIPKGQILYEPEVSASPKGAPAPYVARVHCGGYLNGKYATVIFNEYVASATELPTNAETTGNE